MIPVPKEKRYDIVVRSDVSDEEMKEAHFGTVRSSGRGTDSYLVHTVNGTEYRTKISTLRGDFRTQEGESGSRLRQWEKSDFKPRPDDIFQERLYAVHWMRKRPNTKKFDYEFRSVGKADLKREKTVEEFIAANLDDWQEKGWIPDMRIEPGFNTDQPIRERGWTYWHHLFSPRHLLILGLCKKHATHGEELLLISRILDYTSKLCRWSTSKAGGSEPGSGGRTGGASDNPSNVFYNQALNTFYNYGCRATFPLAKLIEATLPDEQLTGVADIACLAASEISISSDLYLTDPPYGDAVNYHEILEFFIAWLRKNPPPEFADWVWDSRRALAIKGQDEDFRRSMVAAYKRMTERMSDNGLQVIMFTHQSESIWADMANIVWASGLHVTAAWYVV
ncbi:MAG: DNA methylase, partial [Verrucomicrobiota bacterium]